MAPRQTRNSKKTEVVAAPEDPDRYARTQAILKKGRNNYSNSEKISTAFFDLCDKLLMIAVILLLVPFLIEKVSGEIIEPTVCTLVFNAGTNELCSYCQIEATSLGVSDYTSCVSHTDYDGFWDIGTGYIVDENFSVLEGIDGLIGENLTFARRDVMDLENMVYDTFEKPFPLEDILCTEITDTGIIYLAKGVRDTFLVEQKYDGTTTQIYLTDVMVPGMVIMDIVTSNSYAGFIVAYYYTEFKYAVMKADFETNSCTEIAKVPTGIIPYALFHVSDTRMATIKSFTGYTGAVDIPEDILLSVIECVPQTSRCMYGYYTLDFELVVDFGLAPDEALMSVDVLDLGQIFGYQPQTGQYITFYGDSLLPTEDQFVGFILGSDTIYPKTKQGTYTSSDVYTVFFDQGVTVELSPITIDANGSNNVPLLSTSPYVVIGGELTIDISAFEGDIYDLDGYELTLFSYAATGSWSGISIEGEEYLDGCVEIETTPTTTGIYFSVIERCKTDQSSKTIYSIAFISHCLC